jgi:triacylglycerol lipase
MLATLRLQPRVPPEPLSDAVERVDHTVPGPPGAPDLAVRVHRPVGIDGVLPCIYSIHGGGYVMGSYAGDDGRFDSWCPRHLCVGVSVEYRLAPETPYPGPLDDCYAGLTWIHGNADELGVDASRVGIVGASAGGGLAAGLALLARDRQELPVAFQLLIYPMIDDRQITPSSRMAAPIWNPAANEFGWRSYLGPLYDADVPAYAAPSRATDLSGLPPGYVAVGTLDGFHDENVDYATRLNQAGVPTELHVYAGAPHGFLNMMAGTPVAQRAGRAMNEWLERQLYPDNRTGLSADPG